MNKEELELWEGNYFIIGRAVGEYDTVVKEGIEEGCIIAKDKYNTPPFYVHLIENNNIYGKFLNQ